MFLETGLKPSLIYLYLLVYTTEILPVFDCVTEKPRIIEGSKDVLVQENSDVFLHCRATGEPEPTIIWKKVDDQLPQGRSVVILERCPSFL
jgi:hypothetical protein